MSHDQRIDQSATSIQSSLNTNGGSFLMTSHVRSALWTLLLKTLLETNKSISLFTKSVAHTAFWFHSNCTSWWYIFMRSISMLLIPFFKRDQENVTFIILHVLMTNDYTSYVYHSNVLWSLWNYVVVDLIWIISNKNWGNSSWNT